MSTALITMVKDEADVIGPFIRHSAWHTDHLYIADHGSTDGTRELILEEDAPVTVTDITEPGYWQSKYMTELAMMALADGHDWVICADADEVWYVGADAERPIREFLAGQAPDVQIVTAEMYHHIPTRIDPAKNGNPFRRIGWRKREHGTLPKVACRLHPSLVIHPGNHGASYEGVALSVGGLVIRHFSWRTREQYLRKIRNGVEAYKQTDLPKGTGEHWRMWEGKSDEAIIGQFDTWFYSHRPKQDLSLIYDPAPVAPGC